MPSSLAPDFRTFTAAPLPCRMYPALFHAPDGEHDKRKARREQAAIDVCLDCPLMVTCQTWARSSNAPGVAGGETEAERAAAGYGPVDRDVDGECQPACGTEAGARWHRRHSEVVDQRCMEAEAVAHKLRRRAREAALKSQWPPRLTPTERKVLQAFAEGCDRGRIGARYGIGRKQVGKYMYQLRKALRVAQDSDLVAAARAAGVLSAQPADYAKAA